MNRITFNIDTHLDHDEARWIGANCETVASVLKEWAEELSNAGHSEYSRIVQNMAESMETMAAHAESRVKW